MAEICVAGTGGQNESVVVQIIATIEQDTTRAHVHAGHRGEQCRDLGPPAHQEPNGPGDFRGCEGGRSNLIEQRLEDVMVAPIDHRDVHRRAGQSVGRFQAAEAAAYDHDVMAVC